MNFNISKHGEKYRINLNHDGDNFTSKLMTKTEALKHHKRLEGGFVPPRPRPIRMTPEMDARWRQAIQLNEPERTTAKLNVLRDFNIGGCLGTRVEPCYEIPLINGMICSFPVNMWDLGIRPEGMVPNWSPPPRTEPSRTESIERGRGLKGGGIINDLADAVHYVQRLYSVSKHFTRNQFLLNYRSNHLLITHLRRCIELLVSTLETEHESYYYQYHEITGKPMNDGTMFYNCIEGLIHPDF